MNPQTPSTAPDPLAAAEPAAAATTPAATAAESAAAELAELIAVVDRLRDPQAGCPWDLAQSHESLIPYLLEEAHELADAIRHGDDRHLQEELGDLLLQVVLHSRIAAETARFDLAAVARGLRAKLVRRHPHVFGPEAGGDPAAAAADPEALRASWEAIKAQERAELAERAAAAPGAPDAAASASGSPAPSASPLSEALTAKVRGQPALAGALLISRKAAAAGFEWPDLEGVWGKVAEEMAELQEAVASGNREHAQEELGDLLFTLVNVARWCQISPEEGLAGTNQRFLQRFSRVEAALAGDLAGRSLVELEGHWRQAKAAIRAEAAIRGEMAIGAEASGPPTEADSLNRPLD